MLIKIIEIIQESAHPDIKLLPDVLIENLYLDSLEQIEVITGIEEKFDIIVPDDIFEECKTLEDLANEIKKIIDTK